jgi:putative ABC transport system permease protein
MMGLAIIIATPLSYFINKSWLDYMAVRVDLGLGTLIISSLIMLILGLVTIIPLTLRISIRNPIEALKIE